MNYNKERLKSFLLEILDKHYESSMNFDIQMTDVVIEDQTEVVLDINIHPKVSYINCDVTLIKNSDVL